MGWRYYHNGEQATEVRALTQEEIDELRSIAHTTAESFVWPLAITAFVSLWLAVSVATEAGRFGIIAGLVPWILFGVPATVHSYQLSRDRRLARSGLADGRAITFSLDHDDTGAKEVLETTAHGLVLAATRTFLRYCPPIKVIHVAEPTAPGAPYRTLTDDEMIELSWYGRARLDASHACCLPFVAGPFLLVWIGVGSENSLIAAFILAVVGLAATILLIRDSFVDASLCGEALTDPRAMRIESEEDGYEIAEILSAGGICWTIDGGPSYWRIYGNSPGSLASEIHERLEEDD